mmetsp:Transcript_19207/g.27028  ORF Transcript_19207/g.27028 Transcript_19207/m.27028 type:complete len:86 (-) Transcript_19207:422-679(-)
MFTLQSCFIRKKIIIICLKLFSQRHHALRGYHPEACSDYDDILISSSSLASNLYYADFPEQDIQKWRVYDTLFVSRKGLVATTVS